MSHHMGDIYLQLKNISPIQLKDFPIELRNNGQKPIFELLVAQGDPLSASFYLYNVNQRQRPLQKSTSQSFIQPMTFKLSFMGCMGYRTSSPQLRYRKHCHSGYQHQWDPLRDRVCLFWTWELRWPPLVHPQSLSSCWRSQLSAAPSQPRIRSQGRWATLASPQQTRRNPIASKGPQDLVGRSVPRTPLLFLGVQVLRWHTIRSSQQKVGFRGWMQLWCRQWPKGSQSG